VQQTTLSLTLLSNERWQYSFQSGETIVLLYWFEIASEYGDAHLLVDLQRVFDDLIYQRLKQWKKKRQIEVMRSGTRSDSP